MNNLINLDLKSEIAVENCDVQIELFDRELVRATIAAGHNFDKNPPTQRDSGTKKIKKNDQI